MPLKTSRRSSVLSLSLPPDTGYLVGHTDAGLGVAVDFRALDPIANRLRTRLRFSGGTRIAAVALVNAGDTVATTPVLIATGTSGRLAPLIPAARLVPPGARGGLAAHSRIGPGHAATVYVALRGLGNEPVAAIHAWAGGRLVGTLKIQIR